MVTKPGACPGNHRAQGSGQPCGAASWWQGKRSQIQVHLTAYFWTEQTQEELANSTHKQREQNPVCMRLQC